MTTAFKTRLTVVVFAALAVWPIAHHILVLRYDLNPWKFAGWSMYCTPKAPPVISLREIRDQRLHHIDAESHPLVVEHQRQYQQCYFHLGRLCSYHSLAAAVFDAQPSLSALLLVVHVPRLERESATISNERFAWACGRVRADATLRCEPKTLSD